MRLLPLIVLLSSLCFAARLPIFIPFNQEIECTPELGSMISRADCTRAIALLPEDPPGAIGPQTFYFSPLPFGVYRLPRTYKYGNCKVKVDFIGLAVLERSEWSSIRELAGGIVDRCVGLASGPGGRARTGESDRIGVSIRGRSRDGDDENAIQAAGNETMQGYRYRR